MLINKLILAVYIICMLSIIVGAIVFCEYGEQYASNQYFI